MSARCRLCGRPLKNPESVKAGIGETCRRKSEGPAPRKLRAVSGSSRAGETQIPLFEGGEVKAPKVMAYEAVRRPRNAPAMRFESEVVIYPCGKDEPGESYWVANGHVASVVGDLADNPHRQWVIETLNAAVIAGASESQAV